jgi:hypothetical protein
MTQKISDLLLIGTRAVLEEQITKNVVNIGTVSGTVNIDLLQGYHQYFILSDNTTFNPPTTPINKVITIKLIIEINNISGVTLNFGENIFGLGGSFPTFNLTNNALNYIILEGVPDYGWICDGGALN